MPPDWDESPFGAGFIDSRKVPSFGREGVRAPGGPTAAGKLGIAPRRPNCSNCGPNSARIGDSCKPINDLLLLVNFSLSGGTPKPWSRSEQTLGNFVFFPQHYLEKRSIG